MKTILISLFFAILLESTILTIPLSLIAIIFLTIIYKDKTIFFGAFLVGALLDIFSLRTLGLYSLYFTILVFLIFLYQKKFEVESINFIAVFSFLGSLGYLLIEKTSHPVEASILSSIIASLSFLAFKSLEKKTFKYI